MRLAQYLMVCIIPQGYYATVGQFNLPQLHPTLFCFHVDFGMTCLMYFIIYLLELIIHCYVSALCHFYACISLKSIKVI